MKKLLLLACILVSSVCVAQGLKSNSLLLKGSISSGEFVKTRMVVTAYSDTIVDKIVRGKYRVTLATSESYEVTFTNGASTKSIMVDGAPKSGYQITLDLDWVLPNDMTAFMIYNEKIDNYVFTVAEAAY